MRRRILLPQGDGKLWLYNEGIEIASGLTLSVTSRNGTITRQQNQIEARYLRGYGIGTEYSYAESIIVTSIKIDVTKYTKLYCTYRNNVYPRTLMYLYSTSSIILPTNTRGGIKSGLSIIGAGGNAVNGTFTDTINISSISGEIYLYIRTLTNNDTGGGDNISVDFLKIWLE